MKCELILIVWGNEYSRLMTTFCLPSLLSEENLPSWPYCHTTILKIYMPSEEWANLCDHPVYHQISQFIHIQWNPIERPKPNCVYEAMSEAHQSAISDARKQQSALIFIAPDIILADGSLSHLGDLVHLGKELIFIATARIQYETYERTFQPDSQTGILAISPERCVDISVEQMHPIHQACFWDAGAFTNWPSNLFYCQEDRFIMSHCFHLHPLFIKHPLPMCPHSTIDGSAYLNQYEHFLDTNDMHVVCHNQIFVLSLTSDQTNRRIKRDTAYPLSESERCLLVDGFRRTQCSSMHKWFFQHTIQWEGKTFSASMIAKKIQSIPGISWAALEALSQFWTFEERYENQKYQEAMDHYKKYEQLIKQHINTHPLQAYVDYAVASFCQSEQASKIHLFLQYLLTIALEQNCIDGYKNQNISTIYSYILKYTPDNKEVVQWQQRILTNRI